MSARASIRLLALTLVTPLLWAVNAASQDVPTPPCAGKTVKYAQVGEPPHVKIWTGNAELADWAPADCTGWAPLRLLVSVETAGRFRHEGAARDILGRFAAISQFKEIFYWSHTRGVWRPLIPEASALAGFNADVRRKDFDVSELAGGEEAYYWQRENTPVGEVVYGMRVLQLSPDRMVLALENAHTVRQQRIKLFDPGGYQFLYFIEREANDVWRYYALMRSAAPSNPLIALIWPLLGDGTPSYINRTVAQFRYIAGIRTDTEPPAAP